MEERTYNGGIYRRNSPGEPWQLVGQAPAAAPTQGRVITDPYRGAAESRAQQDQQFEAERLRIAQQQADATSRAAAREDAIAPALLAKAEAEAKKAKLDLDAAIKEARASPINARIGKLTALANQINTVQALFNENLAGMNPFEPFTEGGGRFDAASANMVKQAFSAFRTPGEGTQSDADLRLLNEGSGTSSWSRDGTNLERLANLRAQVESELATLGAPAPKWEGIPSAGTFSGATQVRAVSPTSIADMVAGIDGGVYQVTESGLTRDGQPVELTAEIANSPEYRAAYRERFGRSPPLAADVSSGAAIDDPGQLQRDRDTLFGAVDATFRGAADTLTLGAADPLAALVASAFNGQGFSENWRNQRAINDADNEVNFWQRLGGQALGALPTGLGMARAGMALAPTRPLTGIAAAETAGGTVYGGLASPDDPVAGALIGGTTALIGNQLGQRVLGPAINRVMARDADPVLRALSSRADGADMNAARANLTDARNLGVPMALADADPRLRALAGSATRLAPEGRMFAEQAIGPRGIGQAERAMGAIRRDFAEPVNMRDTREEIIRQGRTAAAPLYEQAYGAPIIQTPELSAVLNTPAGRGALGRANTIAANERRNPQGMGFALDADGNVVLNPTPVDAYGAQAVARAELTDAQQAYKAARQASDGPSMEAASARVVAARDALREADAALAAAPREGTAATMPGYTTQSIDYVKRGLDDILEARRDPITRQLVLDEAGRAEQGVRRSLVGEMDRLNPAYRDARAAYEQYAKQATSLDEGYGATSRQIGQDDLARMVGGMEDPNLGRFRTGYATGLTEQVEKMPFGSNPFTRIYGSPDQQAKIAMVFPEGADNFARQVQLEDMLARTQTETLGGSQTAGRAAADAMFAPGLGGQMAIETGLGMVTGVPPVTSMVTGLRNAIGDRARMGIGGSGKAAEMARLLLEPSPEGAMTAIEEILLQQELARRARAIGAMTGGSLALPAVGTFGGQ